MVSSIRVRFSQLAIPPAQCKRFMQEQLAIRKDKLCVKVIDTHPETDLVSFMPLKLLREIKFLTMEDISTPSYQRIIGRLIMHGEESRYYMTSSHGDVILYISPKHDGSLVTSRIVMPLSMDPRSAFAIHVPQSFSRAPHIIPNEITWEFLHELYCPSSECSKFPIL